MFKLHATYYDLSNTDNNAKLSKVTLTNRTDQLTTFMINHEQEKSIQENRKYL